MEKNEINKGIIEAHKHSLSNQEMLKKDKKCGCFYCLSVFSPKEIQDWIGDKNGPTAVCPHCGIDSVIGESSGYPITKDFLKEMHEYWF